MDMMHCLVGSWVGWGWGGGGATRDQMVSCTQMIYCSRHDTHQHTNCGPDECPWCSPQQRSSLGLLEQGNRRQNSIWMHHLFGDIAAVILDGLPVTSREPEFTLPSEAAMTLVL